MSHESQQPYAPPKSSLVVAEAALEPPPQVRRAIKFLWASFVLGLIDSVHVFDIDSEALEFAGAIFFLLVLVNAVFAFLIVSASKRRNWARIVLLISVVVTTFAYFLFPSETADPWWSVACIIASSILEVIAMIWLFSGPGARWYAQDEAV
jgi:hypothetical protein